MSNRTRYFLIVMGFLVFLFVAPLIILYVTGITYDASQKSFVKTGILAVHIDPEDSNVFLDGRLVSKQSADIKFLKPKEYNLRLSKPGYFDWNQRVGIAPNKVTWVSNTQDKTYLLRGESLPKLLTSHITDIGMAGNNLFELTAQGSLDLVNGNSLEKISTYPIGWQPDTLLVSGDGTYALVKNSQRAALFLVASEKFIPLAPYFSAGANFELSSGLVLALDQNNLYSFDYSSLQKTQLASSVKSFTALDRNIYYIARTPTGDSVNVLNTGNPVPQEILQIPTFAVSHLLVNPGKQLLLVNERALYSVGEKLEKIADNIDDYTFDQNNSELIFVYNNELGQYNFATQKVELITRSSSLLQKPMLRRDIGYCFFFNGQTLQALDLQAPVNEYSLYKTQVSGKFFIDQNAQHIFLLEDGNVLYITIR